MAKNEQNVHVRILKDVKEKHFKPFYLLMGNESYYIDLITECIIENALEEPDRDFNQTIFYGADSSISDVINAAKRFPMMAERQLVVLKEGQEIDKLEELIHYLKHPQPSTILVVNIKNGIVKNKKLIDAAASVGEVYESKKLYDNQLPAFIGHYITTKGFTIDAKATAMVAEAIGTDLSRIASEIDKLILSMPQGNIRITDAHISSHIGISKEFNNFELISALAHKDVYKANQIIQYFSKNQNANPLIVTVSTLFNFFANLLILHYSPDKSEKGIVSELNIRNITSIKDYSVAIRNYNAYKCVYIIADLRQYDAKSKGIGNISTPSGELLRELIYKILH